MFGCSRRKRERLARVVQLPARLGRVHLAGKLSHADGQRIALAMVLRVADNTFLAESTGSLPLGAGVREAWPIMSTVSIIGFARAIVGALGVVPQRKPPRRSGDGLVFVLLMVILGIVRC